MEVILEQLLTIGSATGGSVALDRGIHHVERPLPMFVEGVRDIYHTLKNSLVYLAKPNTFINISPFTIDGSISNCSSNRSWLSLL